MASQIIPPGTAGEKTLHALARKRSELDGRIGELRAETRNLQIALDHIDAAIRIFNPDLEIQKIRPKRTPGRFTAVPGEVTRVLIDSLRDADEPLTSRELALRVMEDRNLDVEDQDLVRVMSRRVRCLLRYHKRQGVMRPVPSEDEGPHNSTRERRRLAVLF